MILYVSIQLVGWSVFCFYTASTIIALARCHPRDRVWKFWKAKGHCLSFKYYIYLGTGMFNVVSDFAILILPMAPIWKLQMPVKRKIMMVMVFATGVM